MPPLRLRPAAFALVLLCLPWAFAHADVVTNPNQIAGTIRFTNENPEILAVIHGPDDDPPGTGEERFRYARMEARSLPPQDPPLSHSTQPGGPSGPMELPYEFTVEAGRDGGGIAYAVSVGLRLMGGSYTFLPRNSDPVYAEPAPDVSLDFEECAGLVRILWENEDGTPFTAQVGEVGSRHETPPGSGDFLPQAQDRSSGPVSMEHLLVRGDGGRNQVSVRYTYGDDPYSNTITWEERFEVVVACDEVVEIVIVIPEGGHCGGGLPLPRIIGRADVLREHEHRSFPLTEITASSGPFSNRRLGFIDADPSSGDWELINLVPSDIVSPPDPYHVSATMIFGEGSRYHAFRPHGLSVEANWGETVDIGDHFVIDPGYLRGDIFLVGPPAGGLPEGSCLENLWWTDPDNDRDGVPDRRSLSAGSRVAVDRAKTNAVPPVQALFPGSWDEVAAAFRGTYELVLGVPGNEPAEWGDLQLKAGYHTGGPDPGLYMSGHVDIHNVPRSKVLVTPREAGSFPHRYCFSQIRLRFVAGAGSFEDPRISFGGTFDGTDFEGREARYYPSGRAWGRENEDGTEGWVNFCVPQGSYGIGPTVDEHNPGGGTSETRLPPVYLDVGCRQVIDATTDLILALDPLPACSDERTIQVSGSVQGDAEIARIAWTKNGSPEGDACTDCGVAPDYSFEVTLEDCDNEITVIAESVEGTRVSVTGFVRFDGSPVRIVSGCEDRTVWADATGTALVEFQVLATDGCDGPVPVVCEPPSGSRLPIGGTPVTCVAEDACGNRDECSFEVTVEDAPPPVADAGPDRPVCDGEGATLGGSPTASSGTPPYTYLWEPPTGLDDPAAANPNAGITGDTVYTVTVTDAGGRTDTDSVEVRLLPAAVASFVPPTSVCEGVLACFENRSVGTDSWSWSFGTASGDTSESRDPCFVYRESGVFQVRLEASGPCGSDAVTMPVEVVPLPVADFDYDTSGRRLCVGNEVDFTNLSSADAVRWEWDLGDGTITQEEHPSHAYQRDGIYLAKLRACNDCGCGPPRFEPIEIAANCGSNCEANSNQVSCDGTTTVVEGDTCLDGDSFNTTSYPCAPGLFYDGANKTYDLNFPDGSSFLLRLVETAPEPNGYDLDLMISSACNPPECSAWGDESVVFGDRTSRNDDYFPIVDGRDGSCGPYRLEMTCLDDGDRQACSAPGFDGAVSAGDADPCALSGILVTWDPADDWGLGPDGTPCADGVYEIWRAPASDPDAARRIGSAWPGDTTFLDANPVPDTGYVYRVHAANTCCGEATLDGPGVAAGEPFLDPLVADAGPDLVLSCQTPSLQIAGYWTGGSGKNPDVSWSPESGLSDPSALRPLVSSPGEYTLTITDNQTGCAATDLVRVALDPDAMPVEADALRVTRRTDGSVLAAWGDSGAASYRLLRGTLADLPLGAGAPVILSCGLAGPEGALPGSDGSLFLLAVSDGCTGQVSSAGRGSEGSERPFRGECP